MVPLLFSCMTSIAVSISQVFIPVLHGGQPGLDDWLPVVAFAFGLAVAIGLAVYNLKKQRSAPSDKPLRERYR